MLAKNVRKGREKEEQKAALPFPSQIHDRPLSQPEAKQDNKNHITTEGGVLEESGSHLCVVLPEHPEEVQQRVGQRTLSGDVLSGTGHSLETIDNRFFTLLASAGTANHEDAVIYPDETGVDVVRVIFRRGEA